MALRAGPDALCLQGAEAGAHRGSLANDDRPDQDRPIRALLAAVRRRTLGAARSRRAGWAVPGTWPTCWPGAPTWCRPARPSCAAPRAAPRRSHKDALADPAFGETAITRAFSGRRARALVNAMVRDHPDAPAGLPRDQQRHPAAARRGGPGRRRRAHEPLRRDGVPPGRGPAGGRGRRAAGVRIAPVSSRRQTKTIEFTPPDVAGVADALAKLRARRRAAGSTSCPGIDEDAVDVRPAGGALRLLREPRASGDDGDGDAAQAGPARHARG